MTEHNYILIQNHINLITKKKWRLGRLRGVFFFVFFLRTYFFFLLPFTQWSSNTYSLHWSCDRIWHLAPLNLVKDRPVWPNIHRFDVVSCTLTCGAWRYWQKKNSKCCQNIAKTLPRRRHRIHEMDIGKNAVIHFLILIYSSLTSFTFGAFSGHSNSTCVGIGEIGEKNTANVAKNIDKTFPQCCHSTAHHAAEHCDTFPRIPTSSERFFFVVFSFFFLFVFRVINLNSIEMDTHCPTPL